MPKLSDLTRTQKILGTISAIILSLGVIIGTAANTFGVELDGFHIATSNDINKAHLRIAQNSKFQNTEKRHRLTNQQRGVRQAEYEYQVQGVPVPPFIVEEKAAVEKELEAIDKALEKLDAEVEKRSLTP